MESRSARLNRIATRRIRAQAAVWITELHGPDRNADLEARVKRWIAEDPRHAAAFELATEAWQKSGDLAGYLPAERSNRRAALSQSKLSRIAAGALAVLLGTLLIAIYLARDDILTTGPGEQKTVELTDGTQVSLNANSRLVVHYDAHVRKVTLAAGEALFEVVKNSSKPFVVVLGDRKVIALGTSFMVRRELAAGSSFAVTLVEGRVAVAPASWPDALPAVAKIGAKLLSPGERLRFQSDSPATIDLPSIEKITAWQRGQLIFDDSSLSEAAAEFNRYGSKQLIISSKRAARLRVGGVFRIGDPASFAHAMASAHHLQLVEHGNRIVLTDPDSRAP